MLIARATDSDIEEIAALVNHAYRGDGGWTNEAHYLTGERTDAATLRADVAAAPSARLMTCRDRPQGPLLGCVWLEPIDDASWYLGLLTIRPDLQARKLGRDLLDAAEAYAAGHGARRIRITVINIRDTLIAWYERRGYRRTGEIEPFPYEDLRFGLPTREDLAFVVMEKRL